MVGIYGFIREFLSEKSPETVDATGFSPVASIPFCYYGGVKESHTNRVGSYGSLVANRNTIDASNISKLYISIDHKPKICLCNAKRYHCLLPFRYALYIMSLSAAQ